MIYIYYIIHENISSERQIINNLWNLNELPYDLQYQICNILKCKRMKLVKFQLEKIKKILRKMINNNINIILLFKKYYRD